MKNKTEKIESTHHIKKFINVQMYKVKSIASVSSVVMWVLTFAFIVYPYIEHRNIHPYVAIPLLFIVIMFIVWLLAHLYVRKLEMYKTEKLAEIVHNPYAIYAIGPFEEMVYCNIWIPMLDSVFRLLPEGKDKQELKDRIVMVKNWFDLGYIPKKDFPSHLKKYYITNIENRI